MYAPKYRLEAIETIGRKILLEYDRTLLEGPPQAIPVETIIETKFNLTLEYHTLRKNGSVLGETIFDDGAAILYDRTERQYRLIAVKAGTILIDERLCICWTSSNKFWLTGLQSDRRSLWSGSARMRGRKAASMSRPWVS